MMIDSLSEGDTMRLAMFAMLLTATLAGAAEPWTTYRGNAKRTGNNDGKPIADVPVVLWAMKSQDHFIASPVPSSETVLVSSLGAFNRPSLLALPIVPQKVVEPLWVRSTPYLKLPTVSSPAVQDGKLYFGDGMHQTDGAILHCVPADAGLPLWQLTIPGELVHLEGSPVVAGGRVFIGGGAAGVLCIEADKASINGKEYDLPTITKMQQAKWKELQAAFEVDKKNDPDFAIPPSEDQLHKATPKVLWQQGKGKWHVDAPVNVVGDRVIVASAFLDKEKVGDRAVHCLDAKTGAPIWRTALAVNPWGGASVDGGTVIVTGSTMSYDPKALKEAKGQIVALDLAKGDVKWKKDLPGGVLGCAAIAEGLAICTCSDGAVRGFELGTGEVKFTYDAKSAIFAPPAVVGKLLVVGDLNGVVHGIDLAGKLKWKIDLGTDPAVKAPGMIYGGAIAHDGKLFVATCNLEGPFARQPTVVVCIGSK